MCALHGKAEQMNILVAYFTQFVNRSGGMEHVCCQLANAMAERGHQVNIAYCSPVDGSPFYVLHPHVGLYNIYPARMKDMGKHHAYMPLWAKLAREGIRPFSRMTVRKWNFMWRHKILHQSLMPVLAACQPDIILSFEPDTTSTYMYNADSLPPVITLFRFNPEFILKRMLPAEKQFLSQSCCIQVLLPSFAETVGKLFPHMDICCIPNAVPPYSGTVDLLKKKEKYIILNVARLDRIQKRQHLLVDAFARIARDFPDWQMEFWGEEQDEHTYTDELKQSVQSYGIGDQVFFKGTTEDVLSVYMRGDIFAFPSAYEGFGLSLAEAMSAGLPAIGFRSCPAVNEIIEDGKTGLLAEDGIEPLAEGLRILMSDAAKRARLGQNAHESMKAYAPAHIWNQWEQLIEKMVENSGDCYRPRRS